MLQIDKQENLRAASEIVKVPRGVRGKRGREGEGVGNFKKKTMASKLPRARDGKKAVRPKLWQYKR